VGGVIDDMMGASGDGHLSLLLRGGCPDHCRTQRSGGLAQ